MSKAKCHVKSTCVVYIKFVFYIKYVFCIKLKRVMGDEVNNRLKIKQCSLCNFFFNRRLFYRLVKVSPTW